MDNLTAYCGLNCATCPLYIATINNDPGMKQEVAGKWGKLYNRSFTIDEMECRGCKSEKKFFLSEFCDIKPCNISKRNECCKQCSNHPCKRIEDFYKWQKDNDTKVDASASLTVPQDKLGD